MKSFLALVLLTGSAFADLADLLKKLDSLGVPKIEGAELARFATDVPTQGADEAFQDSGILGWIVRESAESTLVLSPTGRLILLVAKDSPTKPSHEAERIVAGAKWEKADPKVMGEILLAARQADPEKTATWLLAAGLLARSGDTKDAEALWQACPTKDAPEDVAADRWLRWRTARTIRHWTEGAAVDVELAEIENLWPSGQPGVLVAREAHRRVSLAETTKAGDSPFLSMLGTPFAPWSLEDGAARLRWTAVNYGLATFWSGKPAWGATDFANAPPVEHGADLIRWEQRAEEIPPALANLWSDLPSAIRGLAQDLANPRMTRWAGDTGLFPQFYPGTEDVDGFGLLPLTVAEAALASLDTVVPGLDQTPADQRGKQIAGWLELLASQKRAAYLADKTHAASAAFLIRLTRVPEERKALNAWILKDPETRSPWIGPAYRAGAAPEWSEALIKTLSQSADWTLGTRVKALSAHVPKATISDLTAQYLDGATAAGVFDAQLQELMLSGDPAVLPRLGGLSILVRAAARADTPAKREHLLRRALPPLLPGALTFSGEGGVTPGPELRELLNDKAPILSTCLPGASVAGVAALLIHITADQTDAAARFLAEGDEQGWQSLIDSAETLLENKPLPAPPLPEKAESSVINRIRLHPSYQKLVDPCSPWMERELTETNWPEFQKMVETLLQQQPDAAVILESLAPGKGLMLAVTPASEVAFPLPALLANVPAPLVVATAPSWVHALAHPSAVQFSRVAADGIELEGMPAVPNLSTALPPSARPFWMAVFRGGN